MYEKSENIEYSSRLEKGADLGRVEDEKLSHDLASFEDRERDCIEIDALLVKAINFVYAADPTKRTYNILGICYAALENPTINQATFDYAVRNEPRTPDNRKASNVAGYTLATRFQDIVKNNKELSEMAIPANEGGYNFKNEDLLKVAAIIEQEIKSVDDINHDVDEMLDRRDDAANKLAELGVEAVRVYR